MPVSFKRKIYLLLDPEEGGTYWDKAVNSFIIGLIVLNTIAVIIETVDSIFIRYHFIFKAFEIFSVSIFSIEYLLRLWTCTYTEEYKNPILGRAKYIFSFSALVDLIAVLPFYLPFIFGFDFRFIRIVRLLRLFRFFKLSRYLHASRVITKVFEHKKEELVLSLGLVVFLIVIASGLMYFVEHDAQPNKFSNIPAAMWWSVGTLTTAGYEDMTPITPLGKTLTSIISILGIGLFALPAGILASGFSDVLKRHNKTEKHFCSHCGKEID